MSIEDSIALAVQEVGEAREEILGLAATTATQITAVGTAYQNHLNSLNIGAYVDQSLGDDANAGTDESPYKSIARALELTPTGGKCTVYLKADYHFTENEEMGGKRLHILSATAVKHRVSFDVAPSVNPLYYSVTGLTASSWYSLRFSGVTLVWPEITGAIAGRTTDTSSMFTITCAGGDVNIDNCSADLPAAPACPLIRNQGVVGLFAKSLIFDGVKTSGNGWWVSNITNEAGTDATSILGVSTNLTLL